ncbi:protein of unknown function [Oenococcus oeni]|uniref:hypothetical protein n=1 Tax=Oenococcus oeni TaxID=1247 RepID=UPI00107A8491|nr:hypothetical protein [Oenococcus oeni]AVI94082.1 hypothetical protein AX764_04210 [Oenococcus oeni]SYV99724.1 hypothetical protein OENI_20107 [Oenococcus oeni]SYW03906.1 hypothetical protein OENI_90045 [Oenococcus oeni]SYW17678.1 hypothetical protein OENI_10346 [Oenococcus oeni]VDC14597.1 protein of unknown function [Oenococcus oeni]
MKEKDIAKLMDKLINETDKSNDIFSNQLLFSQDVFEDISKEQMRLLVSKGLITLKQIANTYQVFITDKGFSYKTILRDQKFATFKFKILYPAIATLTSGISGWILRGFVDSLARK